MKVAARRTWRVGDRFFYNRWSEAFPTPMTFEITARTKRGIYFWAPVYDDRPRARFVRYTKFYREVARRDLVRLPTGGGNGRAGFRRI